MRKPFLIFRAGERTALKCFSLLLVCALFLTLSFRLYRQRAEERGSMEVFAGEDRADVRPQGLYALLDRLLGDD
ncbi:MAG: hypothetical protein J1E00_03690 [Oscillospiraceae bacterium]|nr:hypothetical protein [Oscillospiraceae bacterium]